MWNKARRDGLDGAEGQERESRKSCGGRATAGDDYMLQFRPAVTEMQPWRGKRISSLIKEVRMKPPGKKHNLFWKKRGEREREREREDLETHTHPVQVFHLHPHVTLLLHLTRKQHILLQTHRERFLLQCSGRVLCKLRPPSIILVL